MRHLNLRTLRLPAMAQHEADFMNPPGHHEADYVVPDNIAWGNFWSGFFVIIDAAMFVLRIFASFPQ